ncbi:MAG: tetratricopeptide repeat protein [Cyanobacteria bacterium P01_C01_bin.120]
MTSQLPNRAAQAEALFAAGQKAFERGRYQNAVIAFEAGNRLVKGSTFLGGNIQLWLINAYSAAGREAEAIALGEKLARHPDRDVRKQSQRVLEILQAPQLSRRADWVTPLPDLSELEESKDTDFTLRKYDPPRKPAQSFSPAPVPEDLSQINTSDNGFLGAAIVLILLLLGGAWWLA